MAWTIAIGFFVFWILVLLAAADKPPPLGFLWLVVLVAACSVVVSWRSRIYVQWRRTHRPGRYWRVVLDGLLAGVLVSVPGLLMGSGDPSFAMRPIDYVLWTAVLSAMGLFNSVAIYAIVALTPSAWLSE